MQHLHIIDWLKQGQNCHNLQMCVCKLQSGIQKVQINCFKTWKVNCELVCDLQWRTLNEDGIEKVTQQS